MLEAACREGAMKQFLNVPSGIKTAHQKGIVLLRPMFVFFSSFVFPKYFSRATGELSTRNGNEVFATKSIILL